MNLLGPPCPFFLTDKLISPEKYEINLLKVVYAPVNVSYLPAMEKKTVESMTCCYFLKQIQIACAY